jgi:hypothetical protein
MLTCLHCKQPMLYSLRSHRKYCSGSCRVADFRLRKKVAEMANVSAGVPLQNESAVDERLKEAISVNPFAGDHSHPGPVPIESVLEESELLQILE